MTLIEQLAGDRRFILARLEPKDNGDIDKIPTDPTTGWNCKALDPANWMTGAEAQAAAEYWNSRVEAPVMGYGVGLVLGDGYFCIDLDHCRQGDGWAPYASNFIARFPGAYVEVSQSKESLHIMGYSTDLPEHGTRCREFRMEAYSQLRFIYTTGLGSYGSIKTDLTNEFKVFASQFFREVEHAETREWNAGPVPEWNGPADDAELVDLAMRSRSARGVFGGRAMFRDLWTANEPALARSFRAQGHGAYDASGADLALANHLAFWTGKDCARIERIMRQSALKRSKWDAHATYLRDLTIMKAVRDQKEVYQATKPRETKAPQFEALPTGTPPTMTVVAEVPAVTTELPPLPPMPSTVPNPDMHVMTVDGKDRYEATLGNLRHILTTQPFARIGYDEFRACIMIAPVGTEEWRRLTDDDMITLRHNIETKEGFASVGREIMRDTLHMVANLHKFDSAITWLNGLVWDGVPRIEKFYADYCGAVDDEYTRAVGRYMWSGLAGRILDAGCQLDMVIVLQSSQGKKKSTGLSMLAPYPDAFTDGLKLQHDDDNFKRLLRGKSVVEIAELAGLSRADIEDVKRVITRRSEEWIEKYQTVPTTFPRRCMLFGTVNKEQFLPPDDEHRRWLPMQIQGLDRDKIGADREQLWAEGALLWQMQGIQYADAERLAVSRHKQHEAGDVWEAKIAAWLEEPTIDGPAPSQIGFTLTDVLRGAINMTIERMDNRAEKRAASVLRTLGYENRAVWNGSKTVRRWVSKLIPKPPA